MPPIKIAGGGIGGLTLALSFAKAGVASEVFEKNASPKESGYGLQLSPNALRALANIGIFPQGQTPQALHIFDKGLIATMPMAGFMTLSRAALLTTLIAAAEKQPLITCHYNAECDKPQFDACGVHSPFRADKPQTSRVLSYRQRVAGAQKNVEMRLAKGSYAVSYAMTETMLNVIEAGKAPSHGEFHAYHLRTRKLNYQTGEIFHIGDAAHAMRPNLAQGAAMAIEDAVLLPSFYLAGKMQDFIALRTPRVKRVMREAALNNLIYKLPFPLNLARNFVLTRSDLRAKYAWLYDEAL